MVDGFAFWMVVLGMLIAYLVVSLGVHEYREQVKRRAQERRFKGEAFRVSAIAPQIKQVRENHIAAVRARPDDSFYRTGLIAAARQMITKSSYFRRQRSDDEAEDPA
jgi:hypothetical protein